MADTPPPSSTRVSTTAEYANTTFHSLPTELIWKIFTDSCGLVGGWQRKSYPLNLGSVCRTWRALAWANSELWTTLVIKLSPTEYKKQAILLQEWLDRTNGRPLDIYVGIQDHDDDGVMLQWAFGHFPTPSAVLRLLGRHSTQWRTIEFHIPPSWYRVITASSYRPLLLPRLISVNFHKPLPLFSSFGDDLFDFSGASSLHDLAFTGDVDWNIRPRMSEQNIYALTISSCRNFKQRILLDYPNLLTASLLDAYPKSTLDLNLFDVRHETLKNLNIVCDSCDDRTLKELIRPLVLPSLTTLNVGVTKRFSPSLLRGLIIKSGAALSELSLSYHVISETPLILFLASIPTLRILRLVNRNTDTKNPGVRQRFFDSIHPHKNPSFLTNLEYFHYRGRTTASLPLLLDSLLLRMYPKPEELGPRSHEHARRTVLRLVTLGIVQSGSHEKSEYMDKRIGEATRSGRLHCLVRIDGDVTPPHL